jgi:hypothetical protein
LDITPDLRDAALLIRDSIDRFATAKHWARQDYHLRMVVNVVWINFQVGVYAKEYDSPVADENTRYDEICDFFEEDLKDDPGLLQATYIAVLPFRDLFSSRRPSLGENHAQIDDALLNPGWVEPRPVHHVSMG